MNNKNMNKKKDSMIWVLKKYRNYYEQKTAAKLIGKSPEILHEEKLGSSSRLLSTPEKITHLVIVRGKALCAAALRYGDNFVPLIGAEKTGMTLDLEAKWRGCEIVDSSLLGNTDEMKRLVRFDKILEEIRKMDQYADMLLPRRLPPLPAEIREQAASGDVYGIFSKESYWWWQKRTGDLHILGTKENGGCSARTFITPPEDGYIISETTLLTPLSIMMIDCDRLHRLVIHEGITSFWGANLWGIMDESSFKEIKLPHSLKKLERLTCKAEKMIVPEELKKLDLFALITMMGGRWDPVTYGVKKLILPAQITFRDSLPETEPIDYLETIEIYGKASDHNLNAWYQAGMLNVHLEEMLDISYPAAWDRGMHGSYTEKVLSFIKKKKPDSVDWSKGHDMGHPVAWKDWTEEDYDDFRRHFHPIQRQKASSFEFDVSNVNQMGFPLLHVGGYVGFGHDPHSGEIEWQVLAIENGWMLLISRYALDTQPYHNTFANVTWETCSLRRWLNNDFLNKAFNEKEKEAILAGLVSNGSYHDGSWITNEIDIDSWQPTMDLKEFGESGRQVFGSSGTEDKVFLLSYREAETYFSDDTARRCSPTAYARRHDWRYHGRYKPKSVPTWLRSPGYFRLEAASIDYSGYLKGNNLVNDCLYVRPAIRVHISSVFDSGGCIITHANGSDDE